MAWVPVHHGAGSISSLQPFEGCGKAELFAADRRKRCARWERARRRPDLWTPERIAKDCAGCKFWQQ